MKLRQINEEERGRQKAKKHRFNPTTSWNKPNINNSCSSHLVKAALQIVDTGIISQLHAANWNFIWGKSVWNKFTLFTARYCIISRWCSEGTDALVSLYG